MASVPIPSNGIKCKSPPKYLQYNLDNGTPCPKPDKTTLSFSVGTFFSVVYP